MPDTVILLRKALAGIVEEGAVDPHEFREWLKEISTDIKAIRREAGADREHVARHSERLKMAETRAAAASGPGKAGWAGIIMTGLTAAGAAIVAYFKGGKE